MRWMLLLWALAGFGCVGTLSLDDDDSADDDDAGDDDAGDDDAGDDDAGDDDATGPSPYEGTWPGSLFLYRPPGGGGGDKVLFCEGEVQGEVQRDGAMEVIGGCRTPNGAVFEIALEGAVRSSGRLADAEVLMVTGGAPDQQLRYDAEGEFVEIDRFEGGFEGEFPRPNGQIQPFVAVLELGQRPQDG